MGETRTTGRIGGWRGPRGAVRELWRRDPWLFAVAAGQSVLFVGFVAGVTLDPATVGTEPRWLKPAKFAGSLALLTATVAWLRPHLPVGTRGYRRVSAVVGTVAVLEIALIGGQAARGVESHFNTATAIDSVVFYLMGAAILTATLAVAWLTVAVWRGGFDVAPAFAAGIRLGLVVFVLASVEGGMMIGLGTETIVSGASIPLVGWTYTGDFRIAHFVGLHALQLLPAVGYLAARAERGGRVADGRRLVRWVAACYLVMFAAGFALALVPLV